MIQLLEDTNDPNIESFTPRQVNGYNRKKLLELQEEQKELIKQLNVLNYSRHFYLNDSYEDR